MRSAGLCFWSTSFSAFSFAIAPRHREPAVLDARPGVAQQGLQEAVVLDARHQVALVDAVARSGDDGRLEQVGIRVSKEIGADAAHEVDQRATVRQLYPGSAALAKGHLRQGQRPAAHASQLAQDTLVALRREFAFCGLGVNGFDQSLGRFAHAGARRAARPGTSTWRGPWQKAYRPPGEASCAQVRGASRRRREPCAIPRRSRSVVGSSPRAHVRSLFSAAGKLAGGRAGPTPRASSRGSKPPCWVPRDRPSGTAARAASSERSCRGSRRRTWRCCGRRGDRVPRFRW